MPEKEQEPTFDEVLEYVQEKTAVAFGRPVNIPPCRFLTENRAVLEQDLRVMYRTLKMLDARAATTVAEAAAKANTIVIDD